MENEPMPMVDNFPARTDKLLKGDNYILTHNFLKLIYLLFKSTQKGSKMKKRQYDLFHKSW